MRVLARAAIRLRVGSHQAALAATVAELVLGERFADQTELFPAEGKWRTPVGLGTVFTIRAEMRLPGLAVQSEEGLVLKRA